MTSEADKNCILVRRDSVDASGRVANEEMFQSGKRVGLKGMDSKRWIVWERGGPRSENGMV